MNYCLRHDLKDECPYCKEEIEYIYKYFGGIPRKPDKGKKIQRCFSIPCLFAIESLLMWAKTEINIDDGEEEQESKFKSLED